MDDNDSTLPAEAQLKSSHQEELTSPTPAIEAGSASFINHPDAGSDRSGNEEGESSGSGYDSSDGSREEEGTPTKVATAWRRYCPETKQEITVKLEAEEQAVEEVFRRPEDAEQRQTDGGSETSGSDEESGSGSDEETQEAKKDGENASSTTVEEKDPLQLLCLDYEPKLLAASDGEERTGSTKGNSPDDRVLIFERTPWHTYGCNRGEVRLSEAELQSIQQFLRENGCANRWRLTAVPEATTKHSSKSKHKRVSTSGGEHRSRSVKRAAQDSDDAVSSVSNRRSQGSAATNAAFGLSSEVWFTRRSTRVSQPFGENLKKAPDWIRRFHRLINSVCQNEDYKEIATELSDRMNPQMLQTVCKTMGVVKPLGLNSMLSNLEASEYETPLDVFNDLYSIWVGAFRRLQPGSAEWAQTHASTGHFLRLVSSEPLKGDFNPSNSPYGGTRMLLFLTH
eukprot:GHVN01069520.1.p1 GENE.GHVN01069520.1~~GHVN01069520.1.p1  ORF type:complete len:453 (+),score=62.55 GHVN01069520.1:102-1460(+)